MVKVDVQDTHSTIVSPVVVYNVKYERQNLTLSPCDEEQCQLSSSLKWVNPKMPCKFTFACGHFDGDPGGDFGLEMHLPNGSHAKVSQTKGISRTILYYQLFWQVLHPKILHLGALETHEELELSLWYAAEAKFGIDCFFWCKESEMIPSPSSEDNVYNTFFLGLVCQKRKRRD